MPQWKHHCGQDDPRRNSAVDPVNKRVLISRSSHSSALSGSRPGTADNCLRGSHKRALARVALLAALCAVPERVLTSEKAQQDFSRFQMSGYWRHPVHTAAAVTTGDRHSSQSVIEKKKTKKTFGKLASP